MHDLCICCGHLKLLSLEFPVLEKICYSRREYVTPTSFLPFGRFYDGQSGYAFGVFQETHGMSKETKARLMKGNDAIVIHVQFMLLISLKHRQRYRPPWNEDHPQLHPSHQRSLCMVLLPIPKPKRP